jgi:hypothetical protein
LQKRGGASRGERRQRNGVLARVVTDVNRLSV